RKNRRQGFAGAHPGTREARSVSRGALVDILDVGRRPLIVEASEIVHERLAVFGEYPGRGDDRAAVLLADDLPVWSLGPYRKRRAGNAGLVGSVNDHRLGRAASKVKHESVFADLRDPHLIG